MKKRIKGIFVLTMAVSLTVGSAFTSWAWQANFTKSSGGDIKTEIVTVEGIYGEETKVLYYLPEGEKLVISEVNGTGNMDVHVTDLNGKFIGEYIELGELKNGEYDLFNICKDSVEKAGANKYDVIYEVWFGGSAVSEDGSLYDTDTYYYFKMIPNTSMEATLTQSWANNEKGWWIQNSNGTFLTDAWYQNTDGAWYYMGADGYMLTNSTTPDGYTVGADGVWIQ